MMHALHQEKGASLRIEILADATVRDFIDTHADILNSSASKVECSANLRQRLERSNYIFSGMKTFHELNEAFPSLLDENGNRKPFERFLNDVQTIHETYNRNYLRAEYNFVHASADMAAKWEQFAADGDRYNLQYRTADDDRVRPEHAELEGITLPIDDPFWASYYPPNGWNCRCTVVQVRKSKYPVTPHDEAMSRGEAAVPAASPAGKFFRFNPGIQQKTFPDYNPYTISLCKSCPLANGSVSGGLPAATTLAFIPQNQLCQACKLVRQSADDNKKEYQRLLNDPDYKNVQFDEKTGGLKATHIGHNERDSEKDQKFFGDMTSADLEKECQNQLFGWGHKAILRNEKILKPNGDFASCLDLELDNNLMDIACITTRESQYGTALMGKNSQIRRAREQSGDISDSALLYFHEPAFFSEQRLRGDLEWYKQFAPSCGSEQRIHHVYVAVKGERRLRMYDI